jgi:hypothetical protein
MLASEPPGYCAAVSCSTKGYCSPARSASAKIFFQSIVPFPTGAIPFFPSVVTRSFTCHIGKRCGARWKRAIGSRSAYVDQYRSCSKKTSSGSVSCRRMS